MSAWVGLAVSATNRVTQHGAVSPQTENPFQTPAFNAQHTQTNASQLASATLVGLRGSLNSPLIRPTYMNFARRLG